MIFIQSLTYWAYIFCVQVANFKDNSLHSYEKNSTHLVYTRPYSQTYSIQVTYLYMRRYVVFVCPRHTVALNCYVRTNKKWIIQTLNSRLL